MTHLSRRIAREVAFSSIVQEFQGKNLGRRILQAMLNEPPHEKLFATTRTPGMACLLERQEFVITGQH